jgi:dihydrofolate synthase/folylpolyglutamate synthase
MLGDKDIAGVLATLRGSIDSWFAATVDGARAITDLELARRAAETGINMTAAGDVASALATAAAMARPGDRIVVFGSFHTVGPALAALGVPL